MSPEPEPAGVEAPPVEPPIVDAEVISTSQATPVAPPQVGNLAPGFSLPDERGLLHNLSQYRGQKVLLYFYPRDNTPECTTEACEFRDHLGALDNHDVVVLGVSPDSIESHEMFARKFGLTFPLLADEDHSVAERYGVWTEKVVGGTPKMGVARTTFLIDSDGRIAYIFRNVRPEGHARQVLDYLESP